jgi:hypothetical protein
MPGTFDPIKLEPSLWTEKDFTTFATTLFGTLSKHREERFEYFQGLRRKNSRWANNARRIMAILGALAILATGVAAALRFLPNAKERFADWDMPVLVVVLVLYAVMGAMSFYEKTTDTTTSYFRQVALILAIRDLWTKFQFEFLKEFSAAMNAIDPTAAQNAAREKIRLLADGLCADLNKITGAELTEWKTEFIASLSELSEAAKKGSEDVTKQAQDIAKTVEKAAEDAKTAAKDAATAAAAAAKAAADAAKPGAINLTLSGDYDEEVIVSVDGAEVDRTRGKTLGIDRIAPGARKISARSKKAGKDTGASRIVDVKPGIQDASLALS